MPYKDPEKKRQHAQNRVLTEEQRQRRRERENERRAAARQGRVPKPPGPKPKPKVEKPPATPKPVVEKRRNSRPQNTAQNRPFKLSPTSRDPARVWVGPVNERVPEKDGVDPTYYGVVEKVLGLSARRNRQQHAYRAFDPDGHPLFNPDDGTTLFNTRLDAAWACYRYCHPDADRLAG